MEEDIEIMGEIVNNFSSDDEGHKIENNENMLDYNPNEFEFETIYNKFILKKDFICRKMREKNDSSK